MKKYELVEDDFIVFDGEETFHKRLQEDLAKFYSICN